jgi:hypothetical protein
MMVKSGKNRTPPTAGKPENHRDTAPGLRYQNPVVSMLTS